MLARHYDRRRDLPALLHEFADQPGRPFARLIFQVAASADPARTSRSIGHALARHIRLALAERERRDVESRLDQLRIVLAGEWRLYCAQRPRLERRQAG